MEEIRSKKGISLVALVITIIVLIILTAAVVMTGINTPKNTEYAIKMYNHSMVQDAVTLYIMTAMLEGAEEGVKDVEEIVPELYDISNKQWTENAIEKLGINLTQEELQAVFTLDDKGVVGWVEGQEPTREETIKAVASIEITKGITKTEYTVGEKVDITGLEVIATYEDGTTENVTSKCTYTPSLSQATATAGEKEIEVSYGGKTAIEKITITVEQGEPTLGSLINGAQDYGKTINYIVNGVVSDWKIYYEDEENGYVFIVPDEDILEGVQDYFNYMLSENSKLDELPINEEKYKIFKLGNDSTTISDDSDIKVIVYTLIENFEMLANKEGYVDSNGDSYVVGAIGSPTIEMFVAGYEEKTGVDLTLTIENNGYKVDAENAEVYEDSDIGIYFTVVQFDELYFKDEEFICLASQGNSEYNNISFAGAMNGMVAIGSYPLMIGSGSSSSGTPVWEIMSVYPVVCLKSSMPAQLGNSETTDIIIELNGNVELRDIEITNNPTKTTYNVGEAIDMSGLVVTATYTDGSQIDVTDSITYAPVLTDITQTVGEKKITVTYEGQSAPQKITIKVVEAGTFESLSSTIEYGQSVNYNVTVGTTTYSDWQIYYATDEHIFLIKTNPITGIELSDDGDIDEANNSNVYSIMKLGQENYILKDSYDNNICYSSLAVATLVNGYDNYANYSSYMKNATDSYIVGAIGGPTIELVAARANAISLGAVTLEIGDYGYIINGTDSANVNTGLPTTDQYIWFASPSNTGIASVYRGHASFMALQVFNKSYAVCPVVCIEKDIPAIWDGVSWKI